MEDLIQAGTVTRALAKQLMELVLQRKNILICGATSSGKTTLANILTNVIPDDERIVLIEDTAEIQIQKPNVIRFEARREQNGLSAVTIRDLLKATLRHRPDRIILGEIRGERPSILCNYSILGTAEPFQQSTPTPQPKAFRVLPHACCKAG